MPMAFIRFNKTISHTKCFSACTLNYLTDSRVTTAELKDSVLHSDKDETKIHSNAIQWATDDPKVWKL